MQKQGTIAAVTFFMGAVAVGLATGANSWHGVVYLTDGTMASNLRNPAAIKRDIDFSGLNGAELMSASQKRLVTAARTILQDGSVGIQLGHFATRDENGQRILACNGVYDRLSLQFEGEGIAADGEKPSMTVEAPCRVSAKDITSIEPVWVPVAELLAGPANDVEVSGAEGTKFKFQNMNGSWPISWSLKSVRLYSAAGTSHEVNITAQEMREFREKPFLMNWMEARRPQEKKSSQQ